ncbi:MULTISPECIES: TetR/AcrR family transcriptional regulator [unclassified Shewanella]|uniref:TetR/AcrR family transcriptional regulator n=1 Tax=unclassified Shewanella TaxID=196818 RepID=UPI000C83DA75|nr:MULTISPECIES: TetR/AcrR family transcriptional regulator [unclassified Shewanella]MDO6618956.1 TetR/AcrR family transcriptional regulator [Shewanella sp. 6_MG-2023]MDO6640006.1 TetR/AcrR family transcriptional regulator [Shewanella sp. 5_MG-2023]MDO6775057.1 TetR/AcrR family transcriptional regulator [Shewanella sp. 3_MG-2023]PMG26905.1 TetR family transcriptional regulator [Shewanella sp. 10N.286.52.C2]PMG50226.1 TetR family transcriptional regulator [Shewanella sp. 10N.286.52.B9]
MTQTVANKKPKVDKKQAILDSALQLFVEQGFHGTSTASIAKKAAVATGTLFHHFPSKDDLLNHLFVSIKQEFADDITQALSTFDNAGEDLKTDAEYLWQQAIDWALKHPIKQRFFLQFSMSSDIDAAIRGQAMNGILHFVVQLISKGQQQKIIADFPVALMLENCHGQYLAAIRYFTDNPQWGNDPSQRQASFELFWRSMKAQ